MKVWQRSIVVFLWLAQSISGGEILTDQGKSRNHPQYRFHLKGVVLSLEIIDDNVVHFEYLHVNGGGGPVPMGQEMPTTPMVEKVGETGPSEIQLVDGRIVRTGNLSAEVEPNGLCVKFFDRKGSRYLTSLCPVAMEQGYGKGLNINPDTAQKALGLGQNFRKGNADMDWIGHVFESGRHGHEMTPFANGAPVKMLVPALYVLGQENLNYLLFMDHGYKQRWDLSKYWWEWRTGDTQLRGFFVAGEDLPSLRRRYMELVGKPALPPKKVFGYWTSEFGFESFDEIDATLKGGHLPFGQWRRNRDNPSQWDFREYSKNRTRGLFEDEFPVDGVACDLQWYGGEFDANPRFGRMGSLEFDNANFGDARKKVASLQNEDGVALMLIEQSYVGVSDDPNSKSLFGEMEKGQLLAQSPNGGAMQLNPGPPWFWIGGMVDWTNDLAAAFWHQRKRVPLVDMGIRYHWTDLAEPEIYNESALYHGVAPGRRTHADIHNFYGFKWGEGIAKGYAATHPNERFYSMSRAGAAGMQRNSAGMWSGDIAANQASLVAHLNARLHMSMVGIDYYSSDIGGFHRRPDTLDFPEATDELYTHWFGVSSLVDIPVRTHVWNLNNAVPASANRVGHVPSNLANLRTRYELTPYYYSLAHLAHETGEPILPPPVYYFQSNEDMRRNLGNQIMIGPWLMMGIVANYGERSRNVFFPEGEWTDYHSLKPTNGRVVNVSVERDGLFRPPLFMRAGAIIPKMFVDKFTRNVMGKRSDGSVANDLILRVVGASEESRFTLYEDDGLTNNSGLRKTLLKQKAEGNSQRVSIAKAEGSYPGAPDERGITLELVTRGRGAKSVRLNGKPLAQVASIEKWKTAFSGFVNVAPDLILAKSGPQSVSTESVFELDLE